MKYLILLIVPCFILFHSCNKDETEATLTIGEDWIDSSTRVLFIDTLTINASTFKFDSIVVTDANRILIGSYTDPTFGTTRSESYAQVYPSEFEFEDNEVYDSIALILRYDHYHYNDTIPVQTFSVHEVLDEIKPSDDDDLYYNTMSFPFNESPIANHSFRPEPFRNDSIHVTLNNEFGEEIFNKLIDNDINTPSEFVDEYKGIVIRPNNSNTAALGFKPDSFIRIYSSIKEDSEETEIVHDIIINQDNLFNHITSNKEGTPFNELEDQETFLESLDSENSTFIQSGIGLTTRFDIPFVETLEDIPGEGIIVDANAILTIKRRTDQLPVRDSLNFFVVNEKSEFLTTIISPADSASLYGTIIEENEEFNILKYKIPIKQLLEYKLDDNIHDEMYLAVYSNQFNSSLDRYIFHGNGSSLDNKIKIEITYAIYDED